MHAATTKIPHLLYEKVLLKTRKWCMILFTIFVFLQWIWWEWEKKTRKIYIHEKQGKIPRLVTLPSPVYKIGGRLFSGPKKLETSRTHPRWDGNPNLQGGKEIKGRDRYGSIEVGNMIFYIWLFRIFNKSGLGYGLRYKNNGDGEDLEC